MRHLTLKGRMLVANTVVLSQLLYICSVLNTPDWVFQKYKDTVTKFIWNNKPPKVKYNSIVNNIDKGGMKLQDLESKVKALHIKWIAKLVDTSYTAAWKSYLATKVKDDITQIMYCNVNKNDYKSTGNDFYDKLLETWGEIHFHEPSSTKEICAEYLWNNSNIRVQNYPINYRMWKEKNIMYVKDLLDNNGCIADKSYLENKYNLKCKPLEYESLISALPKQWKKLLQADLNRNNYDLVLPELRILNTRKRFEEVDTKTIYWHFIDKFSQRPTSELKWREKAHLDISEDEWAFIYTSPFSLVRDSKIQMLQYKVTHLFVWKIEPPD